ncbi:MAG TPA: SRPBCC domain-containing protein [Ktedonobacterales bacterium]
MDFKGDHEFGASRSKVYAAFFDANVLSAAIPGCKEAKWVNPQTLELTIDLNILVVKGTYYGVLQVSDQQEPSHFKLTIERNQVKGSATIDLAEAGAKTKLTYTGEAQLNGPLKAADNAAGSLAAKGLLGQFFKGVEKQISA